MAEETKKVIEIEAKYDTLAQLYNIVEQNKAAIKDLDKSSSEYQKGLAELKGAQREYNQEMRIAVKETTSAKGSYNDLVNQLARLKEAWKQADPKSDAYEQYTREVNRVKAQLEEMDHSIGNWQRNVGNYGNSIASIAPLFGKAGTAIQSATKATKTFKSALDVLKAHPIIAVLGALAAIIGGVAKAFKQSEEAGMRLSEAMAPLKAGGQLVQIAFEGMAKAVASVAEWLGKVADKLGLFSERMKENQALVREGNALKKREREVIVENAKLENEVEKARRIATEKSKYSVQERIKALERAKDAEKKILDNELEIARKKYDLAKREAALSPNSAEMNDALAQAEAELYRVQTNYEQGMRRIVSAHSAALAEMGKATAVAVAASAEAVAQLAVINEDWYNKMDKGIAKQMEERKRMAAEDAELAKIIAEQDAELVADLDETSAALTQSFLDDIAAQEAAMEKMKKNSVGVATAISSVLDSVAGAYQAQLKAEVDAGRISEAEGEKQFENVKALQIAVSTIQMLTGITTALSGAFTTKSGPWDIALAASQAASIAASGIANISKISSTTLGNTAASSAVGSGVESVMTAAPAVQVAVPEYRTLTSAADEQAINQRAASQKVVLVTSELEAHTAANQVKVAEATF